MVNDLCNVHFHKLTDGKFSKLLWCFTAALPGKGLKDFFPFQMSLQATHCPLPSPYGGLI
jgi:hypothetical protein